MATSSAQYPLRPAHLPLRPGCVQSASVRPEARQLRLELAMPPHGENYSHSRGEGYARDSDMAQTPSSTAPAYDRYSISLGGLCVGMLAFDLYLHTVV